MRFPGFEGEWERKKLGDIAKITKGVGIPKSQLSEHGLPCILYGELYTKYKSEIISEVFSLTNLNTKKLVKSKSNDVLIPSSGETAIDISTARYVPYDNILLGGDLNIIRLKNGNGLFFSYQLNGKRKLDIAKIAQGISVVHLYADKLKKLDIYYPKIAEQKKISTFISLIDKRIQTQMKIIEELEKSLKGYCQLLIKSKVPNKKLRDCVYCYSSTLKGTDVLEKNEKYPVYGASGIIAYISTYQANENAILIVKDGSGVGNVQYSENEFSIIGTLNYLKSKQGVNLKYVFYCLKYFDFQKYKVGSGIPHIYFKDYGEALIFCPSLQEQKGIEKMLSAMDRKLNIEKSLLISYQQQKKYLLQNLFI